MSNSFDFIDEFTKGGKALPEQRIVKRNILKSRRTAKAELKTFNGNPNQASEVKDALYSYYMDVIEHVDEKTVPEDLRQKLYSYKDKLCDNRYNMRRIPKSAWSEIFEDLGRALKEIGITKITRDESNINYGYEVFNTIGWNPYRRWKNWDRTISNIKNLAGNLSRKDQDAMGLIWGGKGFGKTTLSLHFMDAVKEVVKCDELSEKNFIFSLKDFEIVKNENITPYQIDEITNILHARRALSNENVESGDILRKMRHKNLMGFACTVGLEDVDKTAFKYTDFGIEVFERGKFKFYTKEKLERFEKKSGEWEKPTEEWIGHFPKKKDRLWELYKDIEDEKDKTREERNEDEEDKKKKRSAHCNQCGYDWTPRKEDIENIDQCPQCKSQKWNEENED